MGLKLDLIGQEFGPTPFTYTEDDMILYALGIGAGVETELDFVYEKSLKVFPTFAVIPPTAGGMEFINTMGMNLFHLLHGEQKIELHAPIPASGTLYSTSKVDSIYDKGDSGAVMNYTVETRDEKGTLLFVNRTVVIDRSAGNFGGDRGPKAERFDPPEEKEPDFRASYDISPNQCALYRLSGDKNPLHIDPEFARKAGLERPILHGLCTYGFAGRAILHSVCESEPARFKSFAIRFMHVVFPGDTLITEGWKADQGTYIIRTKTQDGSVVLGNAVAEVG